MTLSSGDLGAVLKSIFRPKPLKGMLNSIVFEKLKWYIIFIPLLKRQTTKFYFQYDS